MSEFGGGWNYRVVERDFDGEKALTIHECFYDPQGAVTAWSANPIAPQGEDDVTSLRADLDLMLKALDLPVLQYDELPK